MKKIRILTISLVVTLVASVSIFYACEKEKITDNLPGPTTNNSMVKDYDAYIEDLIASTGIDIHELSRLDEVQKVTDKHLKRMAAFENAAQIKGTFTVEKANQIRRLATEMEKEYRAGNYEKVLKLYESYCAICMTIDGFILDVNEYGMQTFTYDINKDPLYLPIAQMEAEQASAVALTNAIQIATPQFSTLSAPIQTQVVAAAVYVNMISAPAFRQKPGAEDIKACKKKAKEEYDKSKIKNTAFYIAGGALCFGGGPFVGIACIAVGSGSYGSAMTDARDLYYARIELCNKNGKF